LWRNKGNLDWLRKARRRTEALGVIELEVDGGGAARWTIEGWRRKWHGDRMNETDATPEIRAAAAYFESRGLSRSFRLMIDGKPAAGVNAFVHGATLVQTQSYRDPAYDRAGVGVHLDERIFRWAADSPYEAVDLGCGEGYKARWGVEAGSRVTFGIAPAHLSVARAGLGMIRGLAARTGSFGRDIIQIRPGPIRRNKNLTTPFRSSEGTNEGPDATANRRTRGQGALTSSDTSERSRGVHT
jgi:CelD/BcsL family acetyltransferase involved in cellulose biosynthesis